MVRAEHACTLRMWLCMKWCDVMHGCMVYTECTEDGSSFEWHQPCNNQTALQLHHLGGHSRHAVKSSSHSYRVTCDKNAVSLLKREEQHYIKAINNSKPAGGGDSSVVRAPDSWLKGRGFESLLERRENFLLQGRLSVLTLISVSVPPPCYHSST